MDKTRVDCEVRFFAAEFILFPLTFVLTQDFVCAKNLEIKVIMGYTGTYYTVPSQA